MSAVRDTLLRAAEIPALYRPLWTEEIWAETLRSLQQRGYTSDQTGHLDEEIRTYFGDSFIAGDGYKALIASLELPDPRDCHVLAAAIDCGAQLIVTENVQDFPDALLAPYGLRAFPADQFLCDLFDLQADQLHRALVEQAKDIDESLEQLLATFENKQHAPKFAELVRQHSSQRPTHRLDVPPLLAAPDMPPKENRGYPISSN